MISYLRSFALPFGFLMLAGSGLGLRAARGADVNWQVAGPSSWNNTSNWSSGSLPGSLDNADIQNGGVAELTSVVPNVFELNVGRSGGSGELRVLAGGNLTVNTYSFVGRDSTTGTVNSTGGLITFVDTVIFGEQNGAVGTLNVNGGTVTALYHIDFADVAGSTGCS